MAQEIEGELRRRLLTNAPVVEADEIGRADDLI